MLWHWFLDCLHFDDRTSYYQLPAPFTQSIIVCDTLFEKISLNPLSLLNLYFIFIIILLFLF